MTLREKVQQEDTHCVGTEFEGGVAGCPGDYGYLNTDIDFLSDECFDCEECWNREFKEQAEWKDNIMHRFMRVV